MVWIAGTQLGGLSDTEITKLRRKHIGFVFQFFNLLPMLTAEENVLPAADDRRREAGQAWREELLKTVGLDDRRDHRPAELSGGQQQRVAIARALDLAADGRLRRRADRQPRLRRPSDEILELLRCTRSSQLRPDDGDGHPRSACGRDRRPDPVPRRRPDRHATCRTLGAERGDRGDGRAHAGLMLTVSL